MKKLLILSDIHYPFPHSERLAGIIKKERPDNIAFLGDTVEGGLGGAELVKRYRDFFSEYRKLFDVRKTIFILGDNDYGYSDKAVKLVSSIGAMNGKEVFTFTIGNMFFFHGNLEKYRFEEVVGFILGNISMAVNRSVMPKLLAALVRHKYRVPREDYLFLGHLHILQAMGNDVFCGTLNRRRVLNRINKALPCRGYVTVMHDGFHVDANSRIKTHRIA